MESSKGFFRGSGGSEACPSGPWRKNLEWKWIKWLLGFLVFVEDWTELLEVLFINHKYL